MKNVKYYVGLQRQLQQSEVYYMYEDYPGLDCNVDVCNQVVTVRYSVWQCDMDLAISNTDTTAKAGVICDQSKVNLTDIIWVLFFAESLVIKS